MNAQSGRICVAMVTHVISPGVRAAFDRLRGEVPHDHDTVLILSCDDESASTEGLLEEDVERIRLGEVTALAYPQKCRSEDWDMAGNLDTVFLVHRNRRPQYSHYWFVEYDVHWEGSWRVFFEHFRNSDAAVLGATVQQIDEVPHKEFRPPYPKLVVPNGVIWSRPNFIKAFLPICRISGVVLDLLDAAYRAGLGGHYEVTVPSIAANHGLSVEDYGGDGRFVRPENRNRFYFARGGTYSHSPGNFVFRPAQRPLSRPNTLWHPVKPGGVPAWHPLQIRGGLLKSFAEWVKPVIWRTIIWFWFLLRWRPLREATLKQQPHHQGQQAAGARS